MKKDKAIAIVVVMAVAVAGMAAAYAIAKLKTDALKKIEGGSREED